MFSAYYNYILYFEENKAVQFNIHFFLHTHKWVLVLASQTGRVSRPLPLCSSIQSDVGTRALPLATFFFRESSSTICSALTLSGDGIKLVKRKRKGIDGPFPSLSQANLWGKEQGKSTPALFEENIFQACLPEWLARLGRDPNTNLKG